ncbi:MAG: FHA domain-containing protein [Candidatus Latescibacterota bacterium]|nr:MAG: FHA domain-containing protein [Candidatus Latescibacterota bacterium]
MAEGIRACHPGPSRRRFHPDRQRPSAAGGRRARRAHERHILRALPQQSMVRNRPGGAAAAARESPAGILEAGARTDLERVHEREGDGERQQPLLPPFEPARRLHVHGASRHVRLPRLDARRDSWSAARRDGGRGRDGQHPHGPTPLPQRRGSHQLPALGTPRGRGVSGRRVACHAAARRLPEPPPPANGTILAIWRVLERVAAPLRPVSIQGRCANVASKKTHRNAGVEVAEAKSEHKNARLTIINSWFAGLEIALKKKKTTLGRNLRCDVCLDDSLVLDEHAAIVKTEEGYVIEDLNSRGGVSLNGRGVRQRKLRSGDTIEIGSFRMKFSC